METVLRYVAPPSQCGYLPERQWCLEYEMIASMSAAEYMERLLQGWRRFGRTLFRPRCPACSACQSLRVDAPGFQPDRVQRRVRKLNEGVIGARIGRPSVSGAKLRLYDRYHAYQSQARGWPAQAARDEAAYAWSFVENPFPTEEWCYVEQDRLVAVGYVDVLPGGLSAIYCYYDPDYRKRSLGTWNVLCIIEEAARRGLPHVYLGYYVAGCRSMEYKSRFRPHQLLGALGKWR